MYNQPLVCSPSYHWTVCSAGLFIQESPPGYSYSDYIQDLEAEDRFQDLVENESLQFEDAYNKTQMKALVIFAEQQAKDENLFKVICV